MALSASDVYRPRIALTSYYQDAAWGVWTARAAIVPGTYVEAVVAAGGTPLLLPPLGTDETVLDLVDGLIVVGGPDVDPARYGAAAHPRTVTQPLRDEHDTILTQAAMKRGLPLFAICRGAQILNVAQNGSLTQHLPDINPTANYQPAPGVFGEVAFTTAPGSLIHSLLGDAAAAPCYHHQAMATVPSGLRVTASAADGTVQALEAEDARGWVLGVQFHPEQNPEDLRLFRGFVLAAGTYRANYRANRKEMSSL